MVSMLYVTPDLTIAITFKNLNSNLISQLIPSFWSVLVMGIFSMLLNKLSLERLTVRLGLTVFIIQQIVTLSKYGHDALNIRHP